MPFCNSTMKSFREHKPHIVFINGYWRVSPLKKPYVHSLVSQKQWMAAYKFVQNKNDQINYPWGHKRNENNLLNQVQP